MKKFVTLPSGAVLNMDEIQSVTVSDRRAYFITHSTRSEWFNCDGEDFRALIAALKNR
jgi:hypothetical protein